MSHSSERLGGDIKMQRGVVPFNRAEYKGTDRQTFCCIEQMPEILNKLLVRKCGSEWYHLFVDLFSLPTGH